jgi:hypothetical protein
LKFIKPSYEEIRSDAFRLYESVRGSDWTPEMNVGVGRGGLFVLRCLQDFYVAGGVRIPYVVASVERYTGIASTSGIKILNLHRKDVRGKRILVVDDVADQGDSLLAIDRLVTRLGATEVRTATIHYKPWSKLKPDYYVEETDSWIIYPWELYESIRLILEQTMARTTEEAYTELSKEARITKEEYVTFCRLASRWGKPSAELIDRSKRVRRLYRAPE